MKSKVAAVREAIRSQLWPIPLIAVLIAVVAGVVLPIWDARVDGQVPGGLTVTMFGGDAEAARTLLGAVSSSLITVTSLTFSLTVVTLQLASSQFSPRLLRTFTSDVFVQATLGLFLATFTFSLTVLRAVRSQSGAQPMMVPRISVSLSFVLALASVVGLIVFLAHLTQQIRVESMLRDVHESASSTIAILFSELDEGDQVSRADGKAARPERSPSAHPLYAGASGFLRTVPSARLLELATELDVIVVIDRCTGDSLVEGTPIGAYWPVSAPLAQPAEERLVRAVDRDVNTAFERSASGDVTYGLRQLTDVVNKALSPGINDPTTAVHALGHLSAVLCQLADHGGLGPLMFLDPHGRARLVLSYPDLAQMVDVSLSQPRRYGAGDPQVMHRLVSLLDELAWHVRVADEHIVRDQLRRMRSTIEAQAFDETELADLALASQRVEETLSRRAGPAGAPARKR